jgi:WD40-like Beta Propeller Repeat
VPPYFVELPADALIYGRTATVRSTVTGRVVATVRPPRPYQVFTFVSGAADDRTFVLAAQRWWNIASGQAGTPAQNRDNNARTVFFRLTFDPATRTAKLTRLAVPGKIRSRDLGGVGISPDGTRLALTFRKSIQIVTLATGATRTRTWPGHGWVGNFKPNGQIFSWSADGKTLAFQQWGGYLDSTVRVRLLDTTAPGNSLKSAKVVLTFRNAEGVLTISPGNTLLTADGSKIVTATRFSPRQSPRLGYQNITEFSVRTGKPVLSQDKFGPVGEQTVLWASPDGSALVISDPRGKKDSYGYPSSIFGVLAGNKFTPIPHGAHTFNQVAW